MKARYFGSCPIAPATSIVVSRWYLATAGHMVLLEFTDDRGVSWVGPEFPLNLAGSQSMEVKIEQRRLNVVATTIDSIQGWTDFILQEKP